METSDTRSKVRRDLKEAIPAARWESYPITRDSRVVGIITKFFDAEGKLLAEISDECDACERKWAMARELGLDNSLLSMYRVPREWRNG